MLKFHSPVENIENHEIRMYGASYKGTPDELSEIHAAYKQWTKRKAKDLGGYMEWTLHADYFAKDQIVFRAFIFSKELAYVVAGK